jgi:hypothetical protein
MARRDKADVMKMRDGRSSDPDVDGNAVRDYVDIDAGLRA